MSSRDTYAYQRELKHLLAIYKAVQREIAAEIRTALAAGQVQTAMQRRLQLGRIVAILDQRGAETDNAARDILNAAFVQGADRALTQIHALNITLPSMAGGSFAGVSAEAVSTLEDSMLNALSAARQTVGRQVNDMFARAQREAALRAVLGAEGSAKKASRRMARQLTQQGATGFVDKAGRRWALDTYSEMAVRTVTRQAVVEGAKLRMAANNITLARVSFHASSCKICAPWENTLVSLQGDTGAFEGEAVADLGTLPNGGPPFHPNCAHTLEPVSTALQSFRSDRAAQEA